MDTKTQMNMDNPSDNPSENPSEKPSEKPSENPSEKQKMFTISCCDKLFKVPKKFIEKSSYFKNMIEDTYCDGDEDDDNILPIPNKFIDSIEDFISIFNDFEKIMVKNIPITDYLETDIDKYIKSFPEQNIMPPFTKQIISLSKKYNIKTLKLIIQLCDFLDLQSLIYSIGLIIAQKIKDIKNFDEKVKVIKKMRYKLGHITTDE